MFYYVRLKSDTNPLAKFRYFTDAADYRLRRDIPNDYEVYEYPDKILIP